MIAPPNAPGRPEPPSRNRPANTAAKPAAGLTSAVRVQQPPGGGTEPTAEPCTSCGRDIVTALRQLVAERREAWQGGVLEGYALGWEQRGKAERERGRAA